MALASVSEDNDTVKEMASYSTVNLDSYNIYGGDVGLKFRQNMHKAGGYRAWFVQAQGQREIEKLLESLPNNTDKSITMGLTFGGAFKERMSDPSGFEYNYDIMLRLVRGEKVFIDGVVSSHEYLWQLFIKISSFTNDKPDAIATQVLNHFQVVTFDAMQDASIYASQSNKDNDETEQKSPAAAEEERPYEHRVCNRDPSVPEELLTALKAINSKTATDANTALVNGEIEKISLRVNGADNANSKYTVGLRFGIPGNDELKEWNDDNKDIVLVFAQDDVFSYQATYLKNSTFNSTEDDDEKQRVYRQLYKYPKSAQQIFGNDLKIPLRPRKSQFLSVLSTVSSTKTTQVDS